ncbi:MAG: hypothetical protein ACRDNZ_07925, partial [Streptosporangiaceae bacterium]
PGGAAWLGLGRGGAAGQARPRARQHAELAEASALSRLLRRRRFGRAVYIGSEHDRFAGVLRRCSDRVIVAAPGLLDVDDASVDLAVLISVLRERSDPADDLAELARILKLGAHAVIGAAKLGHQPERLMMQMAVCGLQAERLVSVSSGRHPYVRRMLPGMLPHRVVEYAVQVPLAQACLGSNLFFLARKRDLG